MTGRRVVALIAAVLVAGCSVGPRNVRLERDLNRFDRFRERPAPPNNSDELLVIVAFSGGGARAAALSYGVLEELARTTLPGAPPRRMLDEIDIIMAVSGGSFTAGYYGLRGDRIFDDFQERFLRADVRTRLVWKMLAPWNWVRLARPGFDRTDLAAELYDDLLFEGATFGDVHRTPGPLIAIQTTDLLEGSRFGMNWHHFGLICSDLSRFPLAWGVAASAAFPVVFSPVMLRNYAGQCPYHEPPWIGTSLATGPADGRRYYAAKSARSYADRDGRPWVYLTDGGVADNLGLHRALDAVMSEGTLRRFLRERGYERTRRMVFIVVNAQTRPNRQAGGMALQTPGVVEFLDAVTSIQIARYNFETVDLLRRSVSTWQAEAPEGGGLPIEAYVVEVTFDALDSEGEAQALHAIPTTLQLEDADVDRLRGAATRLLRGSPDYQRLLRDLGAPLPDPLCPRAPGEPTGAC